METIEKPRFVIQQHCQEEKYHWDLMFEQDQHLLTWQAPSHPDEWPGKKIDCLKIFDHRLKYLTYEGEISQNRGQVQIVAAGHYKPLEIGEKFYIVSLSGDTMKGILELRQTENDRWSLVFRGETV
ncbi:MAG: hypothetical protein JW860_01240 [Sedimentisphaerales bacterium]|nr:hypothetical protein [Sedimentisphaerales bacterium]